MKNWQNTPTSGLGERMDLSTRLVHSFIWGPVIMFDC
jgi:hypothetical protein